MLPVHLRLPRVDRRTVSRENRGSSPSTAVSKLGQFRSPHFVRVFRKRQTVGSFRLVSIQEEENIPNREVKNRMASLNQWPCSDNGISVMNVLSRRTPALWITRRCKTNRYYYLQRTISPTCGRRVP